MKKLFVLFLLLFSAAAFAGGSFPFQKATFNGFVDIGADSPGDGGTVKVTTTATGAYTIKGRVAKRTVSTMGKFDSSGHATKNINIKIFGFVVARIRVEMQLALDGESLTGSVTIDNDKTYNFTLYRAFYSKNSPPSVAGKFTALLPAAGGDFPEGTGYLKITVSNTGSVSTSGKLADGATISCGSTLSKGNRFAVANILYNLKGALGGFVDFADDDTATGSLFWVRTDKATPDRITPSEYSGNINVNVQRYTKPAVGGFALPGLNLTGDVQVSMTGGNLNAAFQQNATITLANKGKGNKVTIPAPNTNAVSVSINVGNGFVSGSAKLQTDDGLTHKLPFSGVIIQSATTPHAEGFFLGLDKSGVFTVVPK